MIDYIGYIAAILTTTSFVPQVTKIYKQKSAKDLSLKTFYVFSIGILFWLAYGIALVSWPMIISNIITASLSITILVLKHKYDKH
ncbi:MAG: SemiSWEET transporter [bacterium]